MLKLLVAMSLVVAGVVMATGSSPAQTSGPTAYVIDSEGFFHTVDLSTGESTEVGHTGEGELRFSSMAIAPDGTVYAVRDGFLGGVVSAASLYTIDASSGVATFVAFLRPPGDNDLPLLFTGSTFIDSDTLLLTAPTDGDQSVYRVHLDEIEETDGEKVVVVERVNRDSPTGFITFGLSSACDGTVYGLSIDPEADNGFVALLTTVDPLTGETTDVGSTGAEVEFGDGQDDPDEFPDLGLDRTTGTAWLVDVVGNIATVDLASGGAAGTGRTVTIDDATVVAVAIPGECPAPAQTGPIGYFTGHATDRAPTDLYKVDLGNGVATRLGANSADPEHSLAFDDLAFSDDTLYGVSTIVRGFVRIGPIDGPPPVAGFGLQQQEEPETSALYTFDYSDGVKDGRATLEAELRGANGEPFTVLLGSLAPTPDGKLLLGGFFRIGAGDLIDQDLDDVYLIDPASASGSPPTIVPTRIADDTGLIYGSLDADSTGAIFGAARAAQLTRIGTAEQATLAFHGRSIALPVQVADCPSNLTCIVSMDAASGLPTVVGGGFPDPAVHLAVNLPDGTVFMVSQSGQIFTADTATGDVSDTGRVIHTLAADNRGVRLQTVSSLEIPPPAPPVTPAAPPAAQPAAPVQAKPTFTG